MSTVTKHNEYTKQESKNPKVIVKYTSAGIVTVKNPDYDPRKCGKCGQIKGFFTGCGCKGN